MVLSPAHDPLPANAVRLPLLQHYVQDELQAEGGAGRARHVAPQGQLPRPAPAQLLHCRQAHVRDSSVAIGALTSIELARGRQAACRPCSPASSPKQKVEQGGETLDSGQVHFVHLVLYHGGQDLSAALPGLFRAVGLLALQDPHHFPGQPPQPGLPPQPLPRQQAGQ